MQIIQSRPSSATLRQAALDDSMKQIIGGLGAYDQQQKTKRAEALALNEQAVKLREQGYDVTPEMVAQSVQEKPSSFAKFFGAKDPEKVDLYANRTKEWTEKQNIASEDRKFKRQGEMLDREVKLAQLGKTKTETNDLSSGNKFQREVAQDQQKELYKKNTNLFNVKNGMDSALAQLEDPNLSEEDKIKVGQGLLKLLNSAEGSDAVGAEEAKRIGSYLEHKMFNVFEPGSMFGRDLDLFTDQVRNNSVSLADRIKRNEEGARGIGSGQSLSQIASSSNSQQSGNNIALQPMNFRGQNPNVQFSPANIPNMSPIQSAQAAELKKVPTQSLAQRQQELRAKQGAR